MTAMHDVGAHAQAVCAGPFLHPLRTLPATDGAPAGGRF